MFQCGAAIHLPNQNNEQHRSFVFDILTLLCYTAVRKLRWFRDANAGGGRRKSEIDILMANIHIK